MRILVADDDPLQREILQAQLRTWGHEVALAEDGARAWDILQSPDPPGIILLDWMMPGLDGPEICRRLRDLEIAGPYVIMVTAKAASDDVIAGLEAGADDYVTKPVDAGQLRARLGVGLRVLALRDRLLETERLRVLGETAGAAAHEIRQPLALMQATVQLCQRAPDLDEKLARRFTSLLDAVRRIDDIVERMSRVSRYRTRRYATEKIVDFGDDD